MTLFYQGLLLGFLGSLHCLGMCGGLAGACQRRGPKGLVCYQSARLVGYCLLGALTGAFGNITRMWVGGPAVQAAVGVLLILYGLGWLPALPRSGGLLVWFAPILKRPTLQAAALMGGLTSLLPCGLLGAAYLKAGAALSAGGGVVVMGAFWLGTLPALLASARLTVWCGSHQTRQRVLAAAMIAVGVLTLWNALAPDPQACCQPACVH